MSASDRDFKRYDKPRKAKGGKFFEKGRQIDVSALEEVRTLLGERPRRNDLLVEHLHLIQDHYGHLSHRHLVALAEDMRLALAEVFEAVAAAQKNGRVPVLSAPSRSIEEAARGLGATPLQVFWLVTLPSIKPGIVAGALFAFIVSFGNFALSLFFASGRVTTLPVAIFEYVDRFQDPTVAAISTIVIGLTMILVFLGRVLI